MDKLLFKQLASQPMPGTLDSWQMCLSDQCSATSVRLFSSWRCFWPLWSQHHQGWNSTVTDREKPTNTSENRELGCTIACQLEAVHWSPWKQTGFGKLIEFGDHASSKVNFAELWPCNSWGIPRTNSSWFTSGPNVSCLRSTHDEADTRIILHARTLTIQGFRRIVVHSRDTDVLVLLAHFANQLSPELWFRTGRAKQRTYVAVHIDQALSKTSSVSRTYWVRHRQSCGIGKTTAWKVFKQHY